MKQNIVNHAQYCITARCHATLLLQYVSSGQERWSVIQGLMPYIKIIELTTVLGQGAKI